MKENEYLLLLFKELSGDIDPAELSQLRDWLGESPDHERIAREYAMIWSASGNHQKRFTPDLDRDFAKIQSRIRAEEQPVLKVQRSNFRFFRAAAAVALLCLAVWGYNRYSTADYFDSMASAQQHANKQVTLSDGTRVWLREGSSMEYPASFEGKNNRRVKLIGEAYFEVAHDAAHPFHVEIGNDASVEVLGTQFNVCTSESATTVLVRSGKVRFSPDGKTQSPVLTANQKAVYDRKAGSLKISNAPTLNDLSWQTGTLEFVKTPLSQVITDLEKYYNVKLSLQNPELADCPHSALLSKQSLKTVLDGLAVAYELKITETSAGEYALGGGHCR